jgi:phage terminase large subunit-like protein
MIRQSPALSKRAKIRESMKKIIDKKTGSIYRAQSSEAYTKHGLNLSACIFDELHAQPNRDLWDVMTFGAGSAREQPIWWIITTSGDDPDRVSVGWEQHEYAMRILAGDIVDPTWYVVIFNYEGDDIYNEDNWALANPSLGTTIQIETLREEAAKAKLNPADERLFRWLRLNQWITTKLTTWLPLDLFDNTIGAWTRADLLDKDCYIGMDLSSTTDLTALAYIFPPQGEQLDWRVVWDCFIPSENMIERVRKDHVPYDQWRKANMITVTEGNVVDYTVLRDRILEFAKFHKVREVCADRAFATMLIQELEQAGLTCVDIPQTFVSMSNPLNETERLLKAGNLTHEANQVARWCFGNASVAKNGNEQIKLVKEHKGKSVVRTRRIDLISAWIDAMARAVSYKGNVDISAEILNPDWGL